MTKTTLLKGLYTAAAVVLGGLTSCHVIPDAFAMYTGPLAAYLLAHSFLPSAKTGAPQG